MATRFCSPDSAGDKVGDPCVLTRSSAPTGLARRTSGSLGNGEAALTTRDGAADGGAVATLAAGVRMAIADGVAVGAAPEVALGETCVVACAPLGISRCKLTTNFITEKPITKTRIPKISGIGDTRSLLDRLERLGRLERRTTGALTGFGGRFS